MEGLVDEPRPGAPLRITDDRVDKVIVKTLERQPANQDSHWSTRSMARETGLSQAAVSRIWRAFGLEPHLVDTWKLSADPISVVPADLLLRRRCGGKQGEEVPFLAGRAPPLGGCGVRRRSGGRPVARR
ncbi:helix-turn-helix domain-containing protein [Micromonospora sp. CNB394]|uniref:helix-turn-helix domain-containing protein n=1 Tax=Micromonospora sp. CNB394 TaxID=1169151 RepID=UPI001E45B2FD|nr:helix-turn-helix domain-containing protein [Micromonospora sp. CNB394]